MIKRKIKRALFDSLVKIKWSKRSNSTFKSADHVRQLDNFDKFGIIKIDQNFSEFADYILTEYVEKILNNQNTKFPTIKMPSGSEEMRLLLSLNDRKISDFILRKEISGLLETFYGRRCYLRQDPYYQRIEAKTEYIYNKSNQYFHVDRYMQLNIMVLMKDLNEKESHTEYLISSHKRRPFDFLLHKTDVECQREIKKNNYKIFKSVGKKGDVFLFNSMGIHRLNYVSGTTRNVLYLLFTNGHNLYDYINTDSQNLNFIDNQNFETINRKSDKTVFYEGTASKGGNYQFFNFQK